MSKDYTNIAGGPFQKYVAKQIEVRKKYLEESHQLRTNNHLIYQNNRNAWVRLTSGTNVKEEHPIGRKYNVWGDELAKKYILQGGSVSLEQNQITNRGGVGNGKLYGNTSNSQGIKPLPGIINIDVSSAGKLGTLQYADISFICYDLEQLEIYEALYMKLGFSMVLEWGHTYYLDNNDQSKLYQPNPMNLFNTFTSKEDIVKEIQRKRIQHSGNYDAMLGTVSNFGWECKPDGTYLCNIKMVGAGDILESLKINQSIKNISSNNQSNFSKIESEIAGLDEEEKKNLTSLIGDRDLSILNRALFDISQYHMKFRFDNGVMVNGTGDSGYRNILNNIFSQCPYNFLKFDENGLLQDNNPIAKRGNHNSLISEKENIEKIPILRQILFNVFGVMYNINDNSPSTDINNLQPQIYITLGNLLSILTATGMIYDSSNNIDGKPYIYIDFNDSLNYCSTFNGQISLDPQICLIPNNISKEDNPLEIGLIEDNIFKKNISGNNYNQFVNAYLDTDNNKVRANMMYILVNINHITDILRELRNREENGFVYLSEFLNTLLSNISKSMGNFNEFRLLVDDTSKSVKIVDDIKTLSYEEFDSIEKYTELPLFGKNSIVYDYNFKSKIGPKMASMITIAAQAEPDTLGEDSFAISNLSRGLEDRYLKYKKTSSTLSQQKNINQESLNSLKTHIKNIIEGNNGFIINQNLLEPSFNIYKELIANYRLYTNPTNKGITIIPLDFSLSMDGISGIIPNSAFTIPTNLLPSNYLTKDGKTKIAFILHSINQNFQDNKWITKITGQTINIRFDKEDLISKSPKTNISEIIKENTILSPIQSLLINNCTRRASKLLKSSILKANIEYLKKSAREVGLISPQAIASLIAISAGESGLIPQEEKHIYSDSRIRQVFPYLSESQYKRATKKGITKKEFFKIVYGEYYPSRVNNRNISDGGKYYGRGYIQLTGYLNYKRYSQLSKIDILNNPDLVNDPIIGAKIAAHYFKDKVEVNQFDSNYFEKALDAVGYNVGDILQKKIEYYNCFFNKI